MLPTIHFDLRGDCFHAFHEGARDAGPVLNVTVQTVGGADMIAVGKHMVCDAIETLTDAGYSVKFNSRLPAA